VIAKAAVETGMPKFSATSFTGKQNGLSGASRDRCHAAVAISASRLPASGRNRRGRALACATANPHCGESHALAHEQAVNALNRMPQRCSSPDAQVNLFVTTRVRASLFFCSHAFRHRSDFTADSE
jgi:hypothetical protein